MFFVLFVYVDFFLLTLQGFYASSLSQVGTCSGLVFARWETEAIGDMSSMGSWYVVQDTELGADPQFGAGDESVFFPNDIAK